MNEELQRRERISSQETRETPPFSVDIFYGLHGTEEDSPGLEEKFKEADIYVPELANWVGSSFWLFRDLSQGVISPEEFVKEIKVPPYIMGFVKKQARMIYKSGKPIIILDLPIEHEINSKLSEHARADNDDLLPDGNTPFTKKLSQLKIHIKKETDLHSSREDFMIVQLTKQVKEVLQIRPELKNKEKLKILMFLGAAHTRVYELLKDYGQEVNRTFSHEPFQFSYGVEGMQRYSRGMEIDNELAAKIALEMFVGDFFYGLFEDASVDNHDLQAYIRKVVGIFSFEDIKRIFEFPLRTAQMEFITYLMKKNVALPKNMKELQSLIAQK